MNQIPEKDWKFMKSLKENTLNQASQRILDAIQRMLINEKDNSHQKYLNIWKMLRQEDKQISIMFDNLKRSTALRQLSVWRKNSLITDEILGQFSTETQDRIGRLISF